MKIGIDVHSIGSGTGGNETYYRSLIRALPKVDCTNQYLLYSTTLGFTALNGFGAPNFRVRHVRPASPYARIPFALPAQIKRDRVDVFHAQFILPPFVKCRTVVSILDIAYEHFPDSFPAYQRAWSKILIPSSAHRADHIVTLSEHSKSDIIRTYGIPEKKVSVTYLGAGDEYVLGDKIEAKNEIARKYGIAGDFVLYLGRLQSRKNLVRLVDAYARVRLAGFRHKLVLAGKQDFLSQPVISRIKQLRLEKEILLPGYIPAEDVPGFYNAAEIFLYPSLYEGFGLPVIEAMACGLPVITSYGSSLEEVAGDAALLVDPLDEISIAHALQRLLEDHQLRDRLSRDGLKRSAQFRYENTARQTLTIYENVIGAEKMSCA
jgi:glycosyltransferase involved in cell wall biosynthesis